MPPPAPDDPVIGALQRVWTHVRTGRTTIEALVAGQEAEEAALVAAEQRWNELRVASRIPRSLDREVLGAALVRHARAHELVLTDLRVKAPPEPPLELPATIAPDAPYPVTSAMALLAGRCELDLALTGGADERARVQRFVEGIGEVEPLLVPLELHFGKGRATLAVECFAFRSFDPPPRYALPKLDLTTLAKAEGLAALPERAPPSAAGVALEQVEAELFRGESLRGLAEAVLERRTIGALRAARQQAFDERLAAAEAVGFASIVK